MVNKKMAGPPSQFFAGLSTAAPFFSHFWAYQSDEKYLFLLA
jgi:hypothetical protein